MQSLDMSIWDRCRASQVTSSGQRGLSGPGALRRRERHVRLRHCVQGMKISSCPFAFGVDCDPLSVQLHSPFLGIVIHGHNLGGWQVLRYGRDGRLLFVL